MRDSNNIEELFKENLSGFESDPGAGVWENISQNLTAQTTVTTGTAVAGKASLLKLVAGVVVAATAVTLSVVYFASDSKKENKPTQENATSEVNAYNKEEISKEENIIVKEEKTVQNIELQQNDIIVKDEKKNKTIIVSVKENPKFNMNKSSVDGWITKRNNYLNYTTNSNLTSNNAEAISSDTKTEQPVTYEVKEVNESKPIASIKRTVSGGPAPLTVTFSNATEEKSYTWNIEDAMIKESSFVHVFEVPGTYTIKLTVKDAQGNTATDHVELTVGEPLKIEAATTSKVNTRGINVFTPNGDGENDYFYFECEDIESFVLQVMDLEGKHIYFETTDPDFRWDGSMLNGDKIPEGRYIYYYKAIGKDKLEHSSANSLTIKTKR